LLRQQKEALNYDEANAHTNIDEENDLDEPLVQPLFSEEEASQILQGIIKGLVQVHGLDIIHRDLKPENIMIRNEKLSSDSVVIVDFGLSAKFKASEKFSLDEKIGTILFMAPEQIANQSYGKVKFCF
jgi:serine/threonine protein kinase